MPPPGLRARVGLSSRAEFALVGRDGARQLLAAVARAGPPGQTRADWLDFGCGCGRIARYALESPAVVSYTGVDVDDRQIAWAQRHLRGRFSVMRPEPPLAFPGASFDVVLSVSIFTHLSEAGQFGWLEEISRVLRPGGLLVATTHDADLAPACAGMTPEGLAQLSAKGFLALDQGGNFNERATFHSRDYLAREWGRRFRLRLHEAKGFVGYQDLSVWEKTGA